jgi:hypothetical protein
MPLCRWVTALCTLTVCSFAISSRADGLTQTSLAGRTQQVSIDASGIQKDDSQLTVVEANGDDSAPLVDTAAKKKKNTNSFWSKLVHPSKWFSSSKKK